MGKGLEKSGLEICRNHQAPMSQKAIKELVLRAIEVEQGDK